MIPAGNAPTRISRRKPEDINKFSRADTNQILGDGATLTVTKGITSEGKTLTVYAQTAGTGALVVTGIDGGSGGRGRDGDDGHSEGSEGRDGEPGSGSGEPGGSERIVNSVNS